MVTSSRFSSPKNSVIGLSLMSRIFVGRAGLCSPKASRRWIVRVAAQGEAEGDADHDRAEEGDAEQDLEESVFFLEGSWPKGFSRAHRVDAQDREGGGTVSTRHARLRCARALASRCEKRGRLPKEPACLVWCLPNIVNWEGNYILDTNTFLIVIMPRKPLAFSSRHREKREGIRGASLPSDLEVQVRSSCPAGPPDRPDLLARAHLFCKCNTNRGKMSIHGLPSSRVGEDEVLSEDLARASLAHRSLSGRANGRSLGGPDIQTVVELRVPRERVGAHAVS